MDMKKVEQRISHYLILYKGKELTREQTKDKILSIQLSEGKMCDECDGEGEMTQWDIQEGWEDIACPGCKGTGKLPDRDIEYAIKKCQEG